MTSISALENVYAKGLFGDYEDKNENKLIKIKERKNLLIVQIAQYKNSSSLTKDIKIDGLNLNDEVLKISSNSDTRILWSGPKNWLLVSTKKDLFTNIKQTLKEMDFAVTDLSHSRAIIELNGENMIGQKLFALSPLKNKSIPVEIVSSHYVDPNGERVRS